MHHHWQYWIHTVWERLTAGQRVKAPEMLMHPAHAGFFAPRAAARAGQVGDWVFPLPDGSRIHVHIMPDRSFQVHRDRFDPGQGNLNAILHGLIECRFGHVGLVIGTATILALWLQAGRTE